MYDVNNLTIIGRLTRDPESQNVGAENTALCKFSIANNQGKKEDPNSVSFYDVITWGKSAESCGKYLKKGSQVVISGRIQQERWQDKESGGNRSKVVINAQNVQFVSPRNEENQSDSFSNNSEQPEKENDPFS